MLLMPVVNSTRADDKIIFSRDVLPILSDKCFVCHGPDGEKESDLRLDSAAGATADLGGYQAIAPGNPDDSELVSRIFDADDPMPPKDSDKQLSDKERQILKSWIKQGGEYSQHWAYVSPQPHSGSIDDLIHQRFPDGVDFAPSADRPTLARRASLVLTGLPPDLEQLDSFLNDDSPNAYERYLDRLLDDPKYGEHQARYWLDAVRYGDTHGLHLDNRRGIYPYRDWVIRSFNRNQPFDEFLIWQLAGDLLPNPSLEQKVATGFVRMNPSTSEGGVIPAEFQAKNNFDRVETLGTALLGSSLVCARCHTHKYDPITQTEYYQLMAFFNSTAESPLDGNAYAYGPVVDVPADIQAWEDWEQLNSRIDRFLNSLSIHPEALAKLQSRNNHWTATDWQWTAPIALEATPDDNWSPIDGFPGRQGNLPKPSEARWVRATLEAGQQLGLELQFSSGSGGRVWLNQKVQPVESNRVFLTLPPGKSDLQLKLTGVANPQALQLSIEHPSAALVQGAAFGELPLDRKLSLLAQPGTNLVGELEQQQAAGLLKEMRLARSQFTTTLVAQEKSQPRETRLLERGEYDRPVGDLLLPAVPEVMGPLDASLPRNRLGLAKWLTSTENPLVARVLVNRFWQQVFGFGLVRTPEDFGLQGQQPTHPELLDALAAEFRSSGWDVKSLLKTMLTSRTFRQDSRWRSDVTDPENRLFARGPGYRLDAEVIRDIALWSSGLLDRKMGGEGVKPIQPPGMWKALMHPASNTKNYVSDQDGRQYRRSIYVYWKRTSPHPMMTLFDAPNRESSCVRRTRSNTPLQSLGLLNESQRIEAARALAGRLIESADSNQRRLNLLFRLIACREATDQERQVCQQLLKQLLDRYADRPDDAQDLAGDSTGNVVLKAAWTQLAITVLASDIAIRLN